MLHVLDVTAANAVPFRIVFVPARDVGPNPHRAGGKQEHALVEFFDRRYPFNPTIGEEKDAQFTGGSYYASSIAEHVGALRLNGDSAPWTVDAATMDLVVEWVRGLLAVHGGAHPPFDLGPLHSAMLARLGG